MKNVNSLDIVERTLTDLELAKNTISTVCINIKRTRFHFRGGSLPIVKFNVHRRDEVPQSEIPSTHMLLDTATRC